MQKAAFLTDNCKFPTEGMPVLKISKL